MSKTYDLSKKKKKSNGREFTEREKSLLKLLIVFAVFVFFGYYGVIPGSKAYRESKRQLESVKYIKNEYQRKAMRLDALTSYKERLIDELHTEAGSFYSMMRSDEVDALVTGIAVKKGLFIDALSVSPDAVPASLTHYAYSSGTVAERDFDLMGSNFKVETAEEEAKRNQFDLSSEITNRVLDFSETVTQSLGADYSGLLSSITSEEEAVPEKTFDGVYVNHVSLVATCTEDEYTGFIDYVYANYPSIRIVQYEFDPAEGKLANFNVTLEVYMAG